MPFSATFKKYFANTSWLFAEKILRMGVSFFVGVWVARYLGPERLGVLSYAQSFVFLFSAFATLGLDGIVVRELVKTPEKRDTLLGTSFVLKLFGAFVTLLLLGSALALTKADGETAALMLIIGSATVFQSFNVIDFYFQSKVQSKYVVFAQAISMVVVNLLKVGLILNETPLIWFGSVIAFEAFITATGLIGNYRKTGMKLFQWHFDSEIGMSLLKDSWPLIFSGLMVSLYMRIDQVMITHMLGEEANGQYAVGIKLSEIWYFIPIVITGSLFPVILDAQKNQDGSYLSRLFKLYKRLTISSYLLCFTLMIAAPILIPSIFGDSYQQSISVLRIHIWAYLFISLGLASNKWILAENMQWFSFTRSLFGILSNITLNYYLIPIYGISGAAVATLISQAISTYFIDIIFPKTQVSFLIKTKALLLLRNA